MFSQKTVIIVTIFVLVAFLLIVITMTSRWNHSSIGPVNISLLLVAPFQQATASSMRFIKQCWYEYFYLVSAAETNKKLRKRLNRATARENQYIELDLAYQRLSKLLQIQEETQLSVCAAKVIGKDISPWYRSIVIDKGISDGIRKGMAVITNEGIAGMVISVSSGYAKVLLIIDRHCAVDAIVQRTRTPGIITGQAGGYCQMKYVLPKYDIQIGDVIISSGLDLVYPKGLRIGRITDIEKQSSGIFDQVTVEPFVDFDKMEEILVVLSLPEQILPIEELETDTEQ